jgi:hypothetical protein
MFDADVSVSGIGFRISAADYREFLEARLPIRHLAARFEAALVAQIMQFGACNAVHKVENRSAVCFSSSRIVSGARDGCTLLNPI